LIALADFRAFCKAAMDRKITDSWEGGLLKFCGVTVFNQSIGIHVFKLFSARIGYWREIKRRKSHMPQVPMNSPAGRPSLILKLRF
jgi:hypothetical protein